MQTRWGDNDSYGHLNNVVHYAIADTAINGWLMERSGVDVRRLDAIGIVAETGCRYFKELGFPHPVVAGIAVAHIGNSSVVYELGLFDSVNEEEPSALIRFVHVYVESLTRRPTSIPEALRPVIESAVLAPHDHQE